MVRPWGLLLRVLGGPNLLGTCVRGTRGLSLAAPNLRNILPILLHRVLRGPLNNRRSHTSVALIRTFIGVRIGKPLRLRIMATTDYLGQVPLAPEGSAAVYCGRLTTVYGKLGRPLKQEPSMLTVRPGTSSTSPPEVRRAAADSRATNAGSTNSY